MKLTMRIKEVLNAATNPMTAAEIAKAVNSTSGSVAMGCQRLAATGFLDRFKGKPMKYAAKPCVTTFYETNK